MPRRGFMLTAALPDDIVEWEKGLSAGNFSSASPRLRANQIHFSVPAVPLREALGPLRSAIKLMNVTIPYTLVEAGRIGAAIGAALRPGDVVALAGDLGAGKTTLARAMLKERGLAGEAPSPTFAIVQPYAPPEVDMPIAHVDLYRIEDPDELIELGLDDYVADGALLIEWPDRLGRMAWANMLTIKISGSGDTRVLTATVPPAWEARWPL